MQHNPGTSVQPESHSLLPAISGDTVSADPPRTTSVSFADCQPPRPSSEAHLIGDITATPHIETHADPPPPAKPPPSHPAADSADNPTGSIIDNILRSQAHPKSPSTPFEFPFYTPSALRATTFNIPDNTTGIFTPSACVNRVVVKPCVFGIKDDSCSSVQVKEWSLMDAGANICLTGDLGILADAVDIHPLPITVALNSNGSSVDDCCTKRGYIPLALSEGTITGNSITIPLMP